ncbi:hypothetical protein [Streptomyces sp. STCH 565 A]|uniref:hypothetical protein n=1 Tax=Streptomyces sp. STCH 565 A TaxID=2950532 RepID=UPI002076630D|nr:hypothetical protein [Streptomyces sp. STCH 565 A]MCM8555423.1 hypothetical protein [Streptomyces sp. STCH 565 A]
MSGRTHPADDQSPWAPWGLESAAGSSEEEWEATLAPGVELPPFRPSFSLQRTRFTAYLADESIATVDIDHTSGHASLYRNNRLERTAEMPTRFTLGSERIEVAASRYGMRRIHLIRADGTQEPLDPAPGTPEHWRRRFSQRHPKVSHATAVGAVAVLIVDLILLAPQLLEVLTHLSIWSDRFPSFVSPVLLPVWFNAILGVAAALAATERALTLRHHRILDIETDELST